jgi:hypothetical protein
MRISYASHGVPGQASEDLVVAGRAWIAVLDGATPLPERFGTGCIHDVVWFVQHLGAHLAGRLCLEGDQPLPEVLADAITSTMSDHAGGCDLSNPNSPSSTVSIVRVNHDRIDYLALADSPLLFDLGAGEPAVITDTRIEHLTDRSYEGVSRARNTEAGFWVASTRPEAAHYAVAGSYPRHDVRHVAALTDGATRLVDSFAVMSWNQLLQHLISAGPDDLIRATRAAEQENLLSQAVRLYKPHDDATAALITL